MDEIDSVRMMPPSHARCFNSIITTEAKGISVGYRQTVIIIIGSEFGRDARNETRRETKSYAPNITTTN